MTLSEFSQEFTKILEKGNEGEAREFLAAHINEFPEKMRNQIIMDLFEEGLQKVGTADADTLAVQEEGLTALEKIEKTKKMLEKRRDILSHEK